MICKIADNKDEWAQAFKLIKRRFEDASIIQPTSKEYYFPSYFALPQVVVFVAKKEQQVVATLVLIHDNNYLGIPAESVYKEEIDLLRQEAPVAEGGSVATDEKLTLRESSAALFSVIQLACQYYFGNGHKQIIITAHPKHNKYYERVWGCELIGDEKTYPNRNNRPVQAYILTRDLMHDNAPTTYKRVFGYKYEIPEASLMTTELVRYFAGYKP